MTETRRQQYHKAGYSNRSWIRFEPLLTAAGSVQFDVPAGENLPAWRAVTYGPGDTVVLADPLLDPDTPPTILGITRAATAAGQNVTLIRTGTFTDDSWNWDVDSGPIIMGFDGVLTQTLPVGASVLQPLGIVVTHKQIIVRIDPASTI